MELLREAKSELDNAQRISAEFDLPFGLAVQLPSLRSVCAGDADLAGNLTQLILENGEFRSQISGPMGEMALPPMLQLLRSKEGVRGLLEFYQGAPPAEGTRVRSIETVSEWKEALLDAGSAPLFALFWSSNDFSSRVLRPIFARLPELEELSGCHPPPKPPVHPLAPPYTPLIPLTPHPLTLHPLTLQPALCTLKSAHCTLHPLTLHPAPYLLTHIQSPTPRTAH